MTNLQQQLLKAKWQKCTCVPYFEEHLDRKKNNKSDCNMCQGTGIQPQIFDNEKIVCELHDAWVADYGRCPCDNIQNFTWKYKSGDVIEIIVKDGKLITPKKEEIWLPTYSGSVQILNFKVLKTLVNNSKIEVLKI